MAERRTELRLVPAQEMYVVLSDGSGLRLGTLLDLSLSGARIQILSPMEAGKKLELFFDEQQQQFQCTVIWASKTEIGVALNRNLLSTLSTTTSAWSANYNSDNRTKRLDSRSRSMIESKRK